MKYTYFCSPEYSNDSLENSISWSFKGETTVSQCLLISSILVFALLVLSTQDRKTPSITFFLQAKVPTLAGQGSEGNFLNWLKEGAQLSRVMVTVFNKSDVLAEQDGSWSGLFLSLWVLSPSGKLFNVTEGEQSVIHSPADKRGCNFLVFITEINKQII